MSQIPSEDEDMWSEANHNIIKDNIIEKPIGKAKFKSKKEVRIRFNIIIYINK